MSNSNINIELRKVIKVVNDPYQTQTLSSGTMTDFKQEFQKPVVAVNSKKQNAEDIILNDERLDAGDSSHHQELSYGITEEFKDTTIVSSQIKEQIEQLGPNALQLDNSFSQ